MTSLPPALTTKLGPLPAWAWGLGLGGAVLVYQRVHAAKPPPEPPPPETSAAAEGFTDESLSPSPLGGGGSQVWSPAPPIGGASSTPADPRNKYETNSQYRRAASDWLIAQGYDSITASNAITRWLDGAYVSEAEAAAVRAVMRDFGLPPEGAPALLIQPAPAPAAPTPTPQQQVQQGAQQAQLPQQQVDPGRRAISQLGTSGPDVSRLQAWLISQTGPQNGLRITGVYDQATDEQVDNLIRFMGEGVRDVGTYGVGGLNMNAYGLIDYVSSLHGVGGP